MLDRSQIQSIIPHRDPFLLVDRVLELVPGERVVAEKDVTGREDFFRGHFPGRPIMPGVLIIEALAQAGAVAALSAPEHAGKLALFGGVEKARFRRNVVPGEVLRLEVVLVRSRGPVGRGEGRAYVGDQLACSVLLTFFLADKQ
ncbi:MAG: 3-hydroxyacyl-ACP dehydratase FabZ [Actinobacteria bacterium]|nr:3-hydroxyacyl-ACP dehydratase FabZ [Actinomycetota bacterium]